MLTEALGEAMHYAAQLKARCAFLMIDLDRFKLINDTLGDKPVVLIGDAVHAPTPHLSAGAGLAVEDAIVLVEALDAAADVATGLDDFMARRLPRARSSIAVRSSSRRKRGDASVFRWRRTSLTRSLLT